MRAEHSQLVAEQNTGLEYMKEDLAMKTKHIKELEDSHSKTLEMLNQSQIRISELEETQSKYEAELIQAKHKNSLEVQEHQEEADALKQQITEYKESLAR